VNVDPLRPEVRLAVEAAQDKKAAGVVLLDLSGLGSFTDYFLLCTGFSSRQVKAISDEIEERLARAGRRPAHREGYTTAEWVLLDYRGFIVHIFTETARRFYDLERLWRSARRVEFAGESLGTPADTASPGAHPA
jgi:ribosome-associated protein